METEERSSPEGYTQAALEALADIALGRKSYPACLLYTSDAADEL